MSDATAVVKTSIETLRSGEKLRDPQAFLDALETIAACNAKAHKLRKCNEYEAATVEAKTQTQLAKHLVCQKEPDFVVSTVHFGYHTAMVAVASGPNPTYTTKFGWSFADNKSKRFVPNPDHPYWRGYELSAWLKRTGALVEPGGDWEGAWRQPGSGRISLLHLNLIIDSRSYWAGIRHYHMYSPRHYDDSAWETLPSNLRHLADLPLASLSWP